MPIRAALRQQGDARGELGVCRAPRNGKKDVATACRQSRLRHSRPSGRPGQHRQRNGGGENQ